MRGLDEGLSIASYVKIWVGDYYYETDVSERSHTPAWTYAEVGGLWVVFRRRFQLRLEDMQRGERFEIGGERALRLAFGSHHRSC